MEDVEDRGVEACEGEGGDESMGEGGVESVALFMSKELRESIVDSDVWFVLEGGGGFK